MANWESLIAERIAAHRETYKPQRIDDARKRNGHIIRERWAKKNPERIKLYQHKCDEKRKRNPKYIEWRNEYEHSEHRKELHRKWRKDNRERINEKKREYNASEKGKKSNARYNAIWRANNSEYERERKKIWWRKTHPNPKPVGRPRKNT